MAAPPAGCPMHRAAPEAPAAPPAGCPMHAEGRPAAKLPAAEPGSCPFRGAAAGASGSSCSSSEPPASDAVDPRNMMPVFSQAPAADQAVPLSTQREVSTIPKADEAGNWVYPSPQQFYHALRRRNKEAEADAMDAVVYAHNVTNERTWKEIMEWEKMHEKVCLNPKLLRFVGRSEELSNGAWLTSKFSYLGKPFDRHDWYIDRCGLKTVRYIIDYYDDPKATEDGLEITIDARPAFDSTGAFADRLRRPGYQVKRMLGALFGR